MKKVIAFAVLGLGLISSPLVFDFGDNVDYVVGLGVVMLAIAGITYYEIKRKLIG